MSSLGGGRVNTMAMTNGNSDKGYTTRRTVWWWWLLALVILLTVLFYLTSRKQHGQQQRQQHTRHVGAREPEVKAPAQSTRVVRAPADADIIEPNLYLGSASSAKDVEWLADHNIRRILNVGATPARRPIPGIAYDNISVDDVSTADLAQYFAEGYEFIRRGLAAGEGVLVHCHAGISRSPTMVAAYLMRSRGLSAPSALALVRAARPVVSPNEGFVQQLASFRPPEEGSSARKQQHQQPVPHVKA